MPNLSKLRLSLFLLSVILSLSSPLYAGEGVIALAGETESLAQRSQNPISDLISLPIQNNFTSFTGPEDGILNILNIQPVIPVRVGSLNVINRIILPIVTVPAVTLGGDGTTGLGDINYQLFFSPAKSRRFTWGAGVVTVFPTGTETLTGQGKLSIGPTAAALAVMGKWVGGALINNVWSVAGDDTRPSVNQMLIQPFVSYNIKNGWFLTTSPIMTANWEVPNNARWTVPVGGGGGRVFPIGRQPVNLSTQFFYNALRPPGIGGFTWRVSLAFLFPK